MLVLSRKINESIIIGDSVEVIVLEVRDGHVKLGIKAPREVSIHREEVYAEIRQENTRASHKDPKTLASAAQAMQGSVSKPQERAVREEARKARQNPIDLPSEDLRQLGKKLKGKTSSDE
ncbi:carbon storage regulator [bacterium (Candidatus Blackallbacteria) CG17_big_fil_post_rev_8_21_14_2_50_48_46]|uniref:Translational regulator CsrA n=1 Tax=bacterium (Candidatus Blackallbacteria) CG17_big_fil_post_rev_8_21_14_2_50_48_46 TaxID=2014261 RepID=A0A2M7G3K0_9BACT|nr:MAG: carbon storage regulator [bacterium (Candidatus Blackallbacteria) CG18_big_fil_WC_8_21_14_2_50_49_26]PIW16446.1 MAG: carbon storage regulator [bacterium (Candidatus Blackallbacteria) CG17_big_fil_post_rev_8_21_14_2_50_48_46]PIW45954.1 MAG: carbon storage regulator [bacterium (Candidatus Blackallbacteria) CG13_big_fil_rev_8_21_14_2_50_49_14]